MTSRVLRLLLPAASLFQAMLTSDLADLSTKGKGAKGAGGGKAGGKGGGGKR